MSTAIELRTDPNSCLNKVRSTEPLFLLRAQDKFAAPCIELWIALTEAAMHAGEGSPGLAAKLREARSLLRAMERWPTKKVPD
jgi:hypothetical protein